MLNAAFCLAIIGSLSVLVTPKAAVAGGKNGSETFRASYEKTIGRIHMAWGQIAQSDENPKKVLELIEKINKYHNELIDSKRKAGIDFRPTDSNGIHKKIKRAPKDVFNLVESEIGAPFDDDLAQVFDQTKAWTKIPGNLLDDARFINSFTQYLRSLWYEAGKATLNINDFTEEFSKRINEITRNNYSLFKCSQKLPLGVEPGTPSVAPSYTCGRGILSDCTKLGNLKARILFVGTVSEADDDIDFSDLPGLYGISDTHSCEKALRSLDH